MKYKKVTKQDVYEVLVSVALDLSSHCGDPINVRNIASLLKTSRYQAKKYIDELKKDGLVKLTCFAIPSDDELYPPYWGYVLTQKGASTDYYKEAENRHLALLKECFCLQ